MLKFQKLFDYFKKRKPDLVTPLPAPPKTFHRSPDGEFYIMDIEGRKHVVPPEVIKEIGL